MPTSHRVFASLWTPLLSCLLVLSLATTTGCTLSEEANCRSDSDCPQSQSCLGSGGLLVRDGVCVGEMEELDAGEDADAPDAVADASDTDPPDTDLPDADASDTDISDTPDAPDADTPDADTPDAELDTDPGPLCEDGLEACDGVCRDLRRDEDHCGGCDTPCDGDDVCEDGICTEPACDRTLSPFGGGDGTEDDPYLICSAVQLNRVGASNDYLDHHFELYTDIDLSDLGDEEFNPIGRVFNPFQGSFDGKGYTIENLSISSSLPYSGMFRALGEDGVIRDLHLVDVDVEGPEVVGAMAGVLFGTIRNSSVSGSVVGDQGVGGLVGIARPQSTIIDSHATADVRGVNFVGGLVGRAASISGEDWSETEPPIQNSFAQGSVIGEVEVGGLAGRLEGTITGSHATGEVLGVQGVGGLVGFVRRTDFGTAGAIVNSYATGDVTGEESEIGGITGLLAADASVTDSYSLSNITGGARVGGVAGRTEPGALINRTFSYGVISGDSGLSGVAPTGPGANQSVQDSYWNGDANPDLSGPGLPLTEVQFTLEDSFSNWDFQTVWTLENGLHPELR